jgi:hypothetical protein
MAGYEPEIRRGLLPQVPGRRGGEDRFRIGTSRR